MLSSPGRAFVAADKALDRETRGPLWLTDRHIAKLVVEAIQVGQDERCLYNLHTWTVMPNHVHLLILPKQPLPVITRWLKGSTARHANLVLQRTGQPFWQDESFDHWVRDQEEFAGIQRYIEENPVSAGLAKSAELWPWSSASRQFAG